MDPEQEEESDTKSRLHLARTGGHSHLFHHTRRLAAYRATMDAVQHVIDGKIVRPRTYALCILTPGIM